MKFRLLFAFTSLLLLAACGKRVDKPIAYGDGLGWEWTGAPGQMRIAVNNRLAREVVVRVDAPGAQYEMTVGPVHQRHMIVPSANYNFLFFTEGKPMPGNQYIENDDRNGAKGLLWEAANP